MAVEEGHRVVGVSCPLTSSSREDWPDRLRAAAVADRVPVLLPGILSADTLPDNVDVILAAHSHDFIGRRTRLRARLGAIGYHPSLLPLHRGRDAVRWAIKMGDRITGGTVYWLSDTMDAGDIAAQDWTFIRAGDTASELWRRELFPMGVRLFRAVLHDLANGIEVRIPQDHHLATWEPSWERPPVRRPDLLLLGDGSWNRAVCTDFETARHRRCNSAE